MIELTYHILVEVGELFDFFFDWSTTMWIIGHI